MGRTMPKSQRQPRESSTMPDIVGPIAGAREMTRPTRPIIRPRECGGTTFIIVVMSSGIMMPVPPAWTTRPTRSIPNPGASRQMSVPALKRIIAVRKICRVVNRCSRKPVVGMTTAIVSMKALVSHCPSSGGMWSERLSSGIAIAIVVSLRIATNAATRSSQITRMPAGSMVSSREAGEAARFLSLDKADLRSEEVVSCRGRRRIPRRHSTQRRVSSALFRQQRKFSHTSPSRLLADGSSSAARFPVLRSRLAHGTDTESFLPPRRWHGHGRHGQHTGRVRTRHLRSPHRGQQRRAHHPCADGARHRRRRRPRRFGGPGLLRGR